MCVLLCVFTGMCGRLLYVPSCRLVSYKIVLSSLAGETTAPFSVLWCDLEHTVEKEVFKAIEKNFVRQKRDLQTSHTCTGNVICYHVSNEKPELLLSIYI